MGDTVVKTQWPIPRRYPICVVGLLWLFIAFLLPISVVIDGAERWSLRLMVAGAVVLLVAALPAFVLPRHRRTLETDVTGAAVIESPVMIVWPAVLACLLLYASACATALLLIIDFDAIESPDAGFLLACGAVGGAPDIFRLLTGRLHRWRLILGPDSYTYQGYRTNETVPWSKVHEASVHRTKPYGVLIDRKGAGPDPVVVITAFDVPAEQIVEEIQARLVAYRR